MFYSFILEIFYYKNFLAKNVFPTPKLPVNNVKYVLFFLCKLNKNCSN